MFVIPEGIDLNVTVSVGFACLEAGMEIHSQEPAAWFLQQVDMALYQAKESGHNRVVQAKLS